VRVLLNVILVVAGVLVIAVTLRSAITALIVPRGVGGFIRYLVLVTTRLVFRVLSGRRPSYEKRDRIMTLFGPIYLLALLSTWIILLALAYAAMYYALGVHSVRSALELSGSSVVTLGTHSSAKAIPNGLTYSEAGLGLLLLTLLITYLPVIYAAFSRRELAVTELEVRAGQPPTAVKLLIRYFRIDKLEELPELWQAWEGWFADVEETHTSLPILAFFRSPQPDHSWITAAGAILDSASVWVSAVEHPNDPDAQLTIRAGYIALGRVAEYFGLHHDVDPAPDDPITISRDEFGQACRELANAGLPLREDLDAAWRAFAGWRVNYDTALLNLARMVEAPIAPWTSDRSPVFAHKTSTLRTMATTRPANLRWGRSPRQN
jgi:hypothetical protein